MEELGINIIGPRLLYYFNSGALNKGNDAGQNTVIPK